MADSDDMPGSTSPTAVRDTTTTAPSAAATSPGAAATPPRAAAARTAWLLFGGIVTGVVLTAGFVVTYGALNWPANIRTEQTTATIAANITTIDLQGDLGDVVVTASARQSHVVIDRRMRWGLQKPTADQAVVGEVLQLRSSCGRLFTAACTVSYAIQVPPSVEVRATTVHGAISVHGTSGNLRLVAEDGSIETHDCAGGLEAIADQGSVTGLGLRGTEARVVARRGDVRLTFAAAPDVVTVEAGRGDIDIAVPNSADPDRYQVRASETTGLKRIGVRVDSDAGAARIIVGTARQGDLTVRYAGQPPSASPVPATS